MSLVLESGEKSHLLGLVFVSWLFVVVCVFLLWLCWVWSSLIV